MRHLIGRAGVPAVIAISMLAGCVNSSSPAPSPGTGPTAGPSPSVEPAHDSPSASALTAPSSEASASTTPALPADGGGGGGPLLIFRLDARYSASAKGGTIETFDISTGQADVIGKLKLTERTCCPYDVIWSADRRRVFLYGNGYLGYVNPRTGDFVARPGSINRWWAWPSHIGDRLAWVDRITGTGDSIVVADLKGRQSARLALPRDAYNSEFTWAPDDRSLVVSTTIPLDTARTGIVPAGFQLTDGGKNYGISAWHLLIVPLDGSAPEEIANDVDLVTADRAAPHPTVPPNWVVDSVEGMFLPDREHGGQSWSPDGRSLAWIDSTCPSAWEEAEAQGEVPGASALPEELRDLAPLCPGPVVVMDVASRERRVIGPTDMPLVGLTWSPDGRWMLVTRNVHDHWSTLLMDAGTGEVERVLDGAAFGRWSPDGAWIVYVTLDVTAGRYPRDVWVARADGSGAHLVAAHAMAGW